MRICKLASIEMEEMADRVRQLLFDDPNIAEKKMFGGICFMLNGNMLCGPVKNGDMMFRVGKEQEGEALSREGAREMDFTGKPMKGFVFVSSQSLEEDSHIYEWITLATNFVGNLPAK